MSSQNRQLYKTIRYGFGWLLRPRLSYLRIRERLFSGSLPQSQNNFSEDSIPPAALIDVAHDVALQKKLVRIVRRNPSPMVQHSRTRRSLLRRIEKGEQNFLVRNENGIDVGCTGFQPWNNRAVHLIIDYPHRKCGYGLSAMLELQKIKKLEGIKEMWGVVFKSNQLP